MHRTNSGSQPITSHKLNMGFTHVQAEQKMYTGWRNCAKDQMIVRGFAPAGQMAKGFPDAYLLPIYTGMRTLSPACNLIVSAVEANNMHRLDHIEEAVVEQVKDSCRMLNDTNNNGKIVVPNRTIPPGQGVVDASLLWPGAPNQGEAAITIGNTGQLPPNPPLAHVPRGEQHGQAPPDPASQDIQAAQVNVTPAGKIGPALPGAAVPNLTGARHLRLAPACVACSHVPATHVNVAAAGHLRQAPPVTAGLNIPATQVNAAAA